MAEPKKWMVRGTFVGEEKYFSEKEKATNYIKDKLRYGYAHIWLYAFSKRSYDPAGPLWVAYNKSELWELVNKMPKCVRKVK